MYSPRVLEYYHYLTRRFQYQHSAAYEEPASEENDPELPELAMYTVGIFDNNVVEPATPEGTVLAAKHISALTDISLVSRF